MLLRQLFGHVNSVPQGSAALLAKAAGRIPSLCTANGAHSAPHTAGLAATADPVQRHPAAFATLPLELSAVVAACMRTMDSMRLEHFRPLSQEGTTELQMAGRLQQLLTQNWFINVDPPLVPAHGAAAQCDVALVVVPSRGSDRAVPLHDHPGMVVLSKVLAGSVRLRSFSRLATEKGGRMGEVSVRLLEDRVVTAADPSWLLTPTHGNIHQFVGVDGERSGCGGGGVILDVLVPRYDPAAGRDCGFYRARSTENNGQHIVLESVSAADVHHLLPTAVPLAVLQRYLR